MSISLANLKTNTEYLEILEAVKSLTNEEAVGFTGIESIPAKPAQVPVKQGNTIIGLLVLLLQKVEELESRLETKVNNIVNTSNCIKQIADKIEIVNKGQKKIEEDSKNILEIANVNVGKDTAAYELIGKTNRLVKIKDEVSTLQEKIDNLTLRVNSVKVDRGTIVKRPSFGKSSITFKDFETSSDKNE